MSQDNTVKNLGYGEWSVVLYNPEGLVSHECKGYLEITKDYYSIYQYCSNQFIKNSPHARIKVCSAIFPSGNVSACVNKATESMLESHIPKHLIEPHVV